MNFVFNILLTCIFINTTNTEFADFKPITSIGRSNALADKVRNSSYALFGSCGGSYYPQSNCQYPGYNYNSCYPCPQQYPCIQYQPCYPCPPMPCPPMPCPPMPCPPMPCPPMPCPPMPCPPMPCPPMPWSPCNNFGPYY